MTMTCPICGRLGRTWLQSKLGGGHARIVECRRCGLQEVDRRWAPEDDLTDDEPERPAAEELVPVGADDPDGAFAEQMELADL